MKTSWLTWLLAGALVASLQWTSFRAPPAAATPVAVPAPEGRIDREALGLTSEQSRALERLCRSECARAEDLEAQARRALTELYAALSDGEVGPEALREQVTRVSELRERSLRALVDAAVEVRSVLEPRQVVLLLGGCCAPEGGAAAGPCEFSDSME